MSDVEIPKQFAEARDVTKLDLVASAGLTSQADLKIAHWRGRFDSARVVPKDDFHSMSFVLAGVITRINKPSDAVRRGFVTLRPNTFEGVFTSEEPCEYITVYLRFDQLADMARATQPNARAFELTPQLGAQDPILAELIQTCAVSQLSFGAADRLALDGWGQVIGAHLLRSYGAHAASSPADPAAMSRRALNQVLEMIEENLAEDLSLERLATLVNMRRTTFCRSFKKAVGKTPHQYLIERRLARAKELLAFTEQNLSDIAHAVGFSSQSHMTAVFQQRAGLTPGQYRRRRRI